MNVQHKAGNQRAKFSTKRNQPLFSEGHQELDQRDDFETADFSEYQIEPELTSSSEGIVAPKSKLILDDGNIATLFQQARHVQSGRTGAPKVAAMQNSNANKSSKKKLIGNLSLSSVGNDVSRGIKINKAKQSTTSSEQTPHSNVSVEGSDSKWRASKGRMNYDHQSPIDKHEQSIYSTGFGISEKTNYDAFNKKAAKKETSFSASKSASAPPFPSASSIEHSPPNLEMSGSIVFQPDSDAGGLLSLDSSQSVKRKTFDRNVHSTETRGNSIQSLSSAFKPVQNDNVYQERSNIRATSKVKLPEWVRDDRNKMNQHQNMKRLVSDSDSSINDREVKHILFGSNNTSLTSEDISFDVDDLSAHEIQEVSQIGNVPLPTWISKEGDTKSSDAGKIISRESKSNVHPWTMNSDQVKVVYEPMDSDDLNVIYEPLTTSEKADEKHPIYESIDRSNFSLADNHGDEASRKPFSSVWSTAMSENEINQMKGIKVDTTDQNNLKLRKNQQSPTVGGKFNFASKKEANVSQTTDGRRVDKQGKVTMPKWVHENAGTVISREHISLTRRPKSLEADFDLRVSSIGDIGESVHNVTMAQIDFVSMQDGTLETSDDPRSVIGKVNEPQHRSSGVTKRENSIHGIINDISLQSIDFSSESSAAEEKSIIYETPKATNILSLKNKWEQPRESSNQDGTSSGGSIQHTQYVAGGQSQPIRSNQNKFSVRDEISTKSISRVDNRFTAYQSSAEAEANRMRLLKQDKSTDDNVQKGKGSDLFQKHTEFDSSTLGGDLMSKADLSFTSKTYHSNKKGSSDIVPKGSVAELRGRYGGTLNAQSNDSSASANQKSSAGSNGKTSHANTKQNKNSPAQQKTFIVGHTREVRDVKAPIWSQLEKGFVPNVSIKAADLRMKSVDVEDNINAGVKKNQDWTLSFRDDGYSSPRNDEQYNQLSSISSNAFYKQNKGIIFNERLAQDDMPFIQSNTSSEPFIISKKALQVDTLFARDVERTPARTLQPPEPTIPQDEQEDDSNEKTSQRGIHQKLEELLKRRLSGIPPAVPPRNSLNSGSGNSEIVEIQQHVKNSPAQSRPKQVMFAEPSQPLYNGSDQMQNGYGQTISVQNGYNYKPAMQNGFPPSSQPVQNGYAHTNGYHETESYYGNIPNSAPATRVNPSVAFSDSYSGSTKMRKLRVMQELASSFKKPGEDDMNNHGNSDTTGYSMRTQLPNSPQKTQSQGHHHPYHNGTLRDTHADSDTSPINKQLVMQMLKQHLGKGPPSEQISSEDIYSGAPPPPAPPPPPLTKRPSVYEMFSFASEDAVSKYNNTQKEQSENVYESITPHTIPSESTTYEKPAYSEAQIRHFQYETAGSMRGIAPPPRNAKQSSAALIATNISSELSHQRTPGSGVVTHPMHMHSVIQQPPPRSSKSVLSQPSANSAFTDLRKFEGFGFQGSEPGGVEPIYMDPPYSTNSTYEKVDSTQNAPINQLQMQNSNTQATEYYHPEENEEMVIKPSHYKRHSMGSALQRPIHIHQNIPGAEAPAYVPHSNIIAPIQKPQNTGAGSSEELSRKIRSVQTDSNKQTFSQLMGINIPNGTEPSSRADDSVQQKYSNGTVKAKDVMVVNGDISREDDGKKDKWYHSLRGSRAPKDKGYNSDSESVKSKSKSKQNSPRSQSPMASIFKSFSSRISPSIKRKSSKSSEPEDTRDVGQVFLPGAKDEIQRRIVMNGHLQNDENNNTPDAKEMIETDDVDMGDFISAQDWQATQKQIKQEGFDFRVGANTRKGSKQIIIQNDGPEVRHMPLIKAALGPGATDTQRMKANRRKSMHENVGKVIVPTAFSGSANNEQEKAIVFENNIEQRSNVVDMRPRPKSASYLSGVEINGFVSNGYAGHDMRSKQLITRADSMESVHNNGRKKYKAPQPPVVLGSFRKL